MSEEEPVRKDHVEPYGGTNVQPGRLPVSDRIAALNHAILDADRYLEKYGRLRDGFVEELMVLEGE